VISVDVFCRRLLQKNNIATCLLEWLFCNLLRTTWKSLGPVRGPVGKQKSSSWRRHALCSRWAAGGCGWAAHYKSARRGE
jgi:hypothetical protein